MLLTDTHTHLYYETDEEKLEQLMQRCFDNQIERLFLPNVDVASIAKIDEPGEEISSKIVLPWQDCTLVM